LPIFIEPLVYGRELMGTHLICTADSLLWGTGLYTGQKYCRAN